MGFDVGKLLGNLLLCHFSQRGHERTPAERDPYRRWILATVEEVWIGFARRFVELHEDGEALHSPPAHAGHRTGGKDLAH